MSRAVWEAMQHARTQQRRRDVQMKIGWKFDSKATLPEGYEVRDDEDFVYLYCGDTLVTQFGSRVSWLEIEREAWAHFINNSPEDNQE